MTWKVKRSLSGLLELVLSETGSSKETDLFQNVLFQSLWVVRHSGYAKYVC